RPRYTPPPAARAPRHANHPASPGGATRRRYECLLRSVGVPADENNTGKGDAYHTDWVFK
ncbi:MAG: hypothetical protein ABDI19_12370, partial [Armatimonadota bacterium]